MTFAGRGALVVLAKEPVPGHVKTRMVPPFTPQQAAEFYAAMLRDVLATSARAARELGLTPILAIHPPEAIRTTSIDIPTHFQVIPQMGSNLGERMAKVIGAVSEMGACPILMRGSDSPILDEETIDAALRALEEFELVVSPDLDGGYNLIGLREPAIGLFDHPMSTCSVLEDTLAKAAALGLRVQVQQSSFDLDTAGDLRTLANARTDPRVRDVMNLCCHTLAYLDRRDLWGQLKSR